jgi:hypothetical protein
VVINIHLQPFRYIVEEFIQKKSSSPKLAVSPKLAAFALLVFTVGFFFFFFFFFHSTFFDFDAVDDGVVSFGATESFVVDDRLAFGSRGTGTNRSTS